MKLDFVVSLILAGLWIAGRLPPWSAYLAIWTAFAGGNLLCNPPPGELWPWLGRSWKLPAAINRIYRPNLQRGWFPEWSGIGVTIVVVLLVAPLEDRATVALWCL